MMKKLIGLALVLVTVATLFAGCGGDSSGKVELVWASYVIESKEHELVLEAVNKKLETLLPNTTVTFREINAETWKLAMSSNEAIDIAWSGYIFDLQSEIEAGAYRPLDELIAEYAPNIRQEMQDYAADYRSGSYNGKQYLIPNQQAIFNQTPAIVVPDSLIGYMDVDALLAAAKASPTSTQALYDVLDSYLEKVYASEDYDTDMVGKTIDIYNIYQAVATRGYDFVGGTKASAQLCYKAFDEKPVIVSFPETEEYQLFARYAASWCEKGYISEDALLGGGSAGSRQSVLSGSATAMWYAAKNPETGEERGVTYTVENGSIKSRNILLNDYSQQFNGVTELGYEATYLTIPYTAKNPERAMQLLDLLRSPVGTEGNDLFNLLVYGFEKDSEEAKQYNTYHYTLEGDCAQPVDYTMQPSRTSKYGLTNWMIGNCMLAYRTPNILEGQADFCKEYESEVRKTLHNTALNGFSADISELTIDIANIKGVYDEFDQRVYYGVSKSGWTDIYSQMLQKLKASNLESVKAALQEQADAWGKG